MKFYIFHIFQGEGNEFLLFAVQVAIFFFFTFIFIWPFGGLLPLNLDSLAISWILLEFGCGYLVHGGLEP